MKCWWHRGSEEVAALMKSSGATLLARARCSVSAYLDAFSAVSRIAISAASPLWQAPLFSPLSVSRRMGRWGCRCAVSRCGLECALGVSWGCRLMNEWCHVDWLAARCQHHVRARWRFRRSSLPAGQHGPLTRPPPRPLAESTSCFHHAGRCLLRHDHWRRSRWPH